MVVVVLVPENGAKIEDEEEIDDEDDVKNRFSGRALRDIPLARTPRLLCSAWAK